ncbi:MAG: helix-turn-helix transcriptional regulator [Actinomycetes bacterium]
MLLDDRANARVLATIRRRMDSQDITQAKLSELLGISQPNVSRRISGQVPLTVPELARIANVLGCTITELVIAADVA